MSVLLIQTMLIAGLLVHRRQRRQAEDGAPCKSEAELRSSYARIRDLARRLITAQEAERTRIARDLHDDVGQQLALLSIELEQLGDSVQSAWADAKRARDAANRTAVISTSVQNLSHQLHPPKLELIGLVAAIEGLRRELASQHQITIDFSHQGVPAGFRAKSRSACSASLRRASAMRSNTAQRARSRCNWAPHQTGSYLSSRTKAWDSTSTPMATRGSGCSACASGWNPSAARSRFDLPLAPERGSKLRCRSNARRRPVEADRGGKHG